MDKAVEPNMKQYVCGEHMITVERYFTGKQNVEDIVKQYILEQQKIEVSRAKEERRSTQCNQAAVGTAKEGAN